MPADRFSHFKHSRRHPANQNAAPAVRLDLTPTNPPKQNILETRSTHNLRRLHIHGYEHPTGLLLTPRVVQWLELDSCGNCGEGAAENLEGILCENRVGRQKFWGQNKCTGKYLTSSSDFFLFFLVTSTTPDKNMTQTRPAHARLDQIATLVQSEDHGVSI